MTEAIIAYVLANILDVVSTKKAINAGGTEINPILHYLMGKGGNTWIVFKLMLSGIALGIFLYLNITWAVWAGSALYGGVAFNNFRIARKLKDK
jgi:hypothetical protein